MDYAHWVKMPPAEIWSSPENEDLLTALIDHEPLVAIRYRRFTDTARARRINAAEMARCCERDVTMKKEAILGVGALGHDAASALVCVETGDILYAIAEERLRNLKHSWHFPYGCIQAARRYAVRSRISNRGSGD